jgi:hypothetical protein
LWTRADILERFARFPRELMEKLIAEECPTGESLSRITSDALKRLGFGTGHIVQIRKLFLSLGIPNADLNPPQGAPRRVSSGPIAAPPLGLAEQIRRVSVPEKAVPGLPLVYAVPCTDVSRDRDKQLCIATVGVRPEVDDKPEKRILLVGGTGSGKTTWLNSVANYLYGVSWADPFRFKVVLPADEERAARSRPGQAFSQTQFVTSYKFAWHRDFPCDFSLVVIDTPGFGDTHGLDRDREIEEQMHGLFEMRADIGMDKVDAVVLVVPAANARLTANQHYICATIEKLFGPEIGRNLVVAATFADFGDPPVIASIQREGITFRRAFKFNNSALFDSNDERKGDMRLSKAQWDSALENFDGLVSFLKELQPRVVLQRRASPALLALVLYGHNCEIARRILEIESLRQRIGFLDSHRPPIAAEQILLSKWTFDVSTLRPRESSSASLFCVICNFSCDSRGNCPTRCDSCFHTYVRFRTEYEKRAETWTTAQLVAACAQGGETKVDVDRIRAWLDAKVEKRQRRALQRVSQARAVTNQLCPTLELCSDSDYLTVLISAEKATRQEGREMRIEELAALSSLTSRRAPI